MNAAKQSSSIIKKYFPELNSEQKEQFRLIGQLYLEWNEKINVISRKDMENIYIHHILHSLAIAKFVQLKPNTTILDVGTGGGFPGIPLAILFPQSKFTLIDSIAKKIKVVSAVAESLNLKNVVAYQRRAEEEKTHYDFIISRAVTRLSKFLPWVENNLNKSSRNNIKNGFIFLKGGNLDEEIAEIDQKTEAISICDFFKESFFETKKLVYVEPKD